MKEVAKTGKTLFATRIDLPAVARKRVVELLNATLASLVDLYSQTKFAHWNVKGPNFIAVHKLFDELAELVEDQIDEVAERATALGGVAFGTIRQASKASALEEFPTDVFHSSAVIGALADRFGLVANWCRKGIATADEEGDPGTTDLLTQVSRALDQSIYFLAAHEQ